ncbi:N-acetylmuramoyl-L-alanine amidase [Corynebacterium sp. ES2794-CONJ1]|uniref:N-acetylmuramoyl-L-alanine amidase n=1 Tax=unclassified Corynebacterium TaxID=2624378 RepID=UPI002167C844|nr:MULTISPECIES: N-acetylmuramoyl-L-alanine amidase [unclassified Corynebacterium]MCS4490462.1 N-acetylmuramoyl-L-alanine amidase [Corynebacterium sp. ES2775-CONJ]MCS4532274.1 N-acetylmuramoyl-L-alanine amidase [Corynebacterium sp. ES2730-CONJ]MCU9519761.1 N-acetylmuramoyl-L-alanine amidase [Corynebacterium sp. ES2794-CONJ1]
MSTVIRVGDKNPKVAEVRAALARLGHLTSFRDDLSTDHIFEESDTYFDSDLQEALRGFQQSRGLIASGEITETTLRVLREASYQLGVRVLAYQEHNHMIGDDVYQLQQQLQELGFYTDRLDGHFGPMTHDALANYQLNYGLNIDGICGPETIDSLGLLGRRITGGSPNQLRERERVRDAGPQLAGKRVVIDPGLGGPNKGVTVRGIYGEITEEELIWDLATRIEGRMIEAGMDVIISRPRNSDLTHAERVAIANSFQADLMICLQADHYPNEQASGCATFYFGSESGNYSMIGEKLSGYIQREIAARTKLVNCGNHARTWDLLRMTQMTCVEIFPGYLSNPGDVRILSNPKKRDDIAEAIVVSVKRLYLMDQDDQPTGTFKFSELLKQELLEG